MDRIPIDGVPISRLALGTWGFAGGRIWGPIDESQCKRVVHAALDAGINLFDTAPNYGSGRSESILGNALAGRSDVWIATKFKIEGMTPDQLESMLTASLHRLRRECIDLMQIHWPGSTPEITASALDTLESLQRKGIVREIGVCNFGTYDLEESFDRPIVSNQLPYSLLWRAIEYDIAKATRKNGLVTLGYSILQQGLLGGRYTALEMFPEGRKRTRHFSSTHPDTLHNEEGMENELSRTLQHLRTLSHEFGIPLYNLALSFVLSRPFIDIAIIGPRNLTQLNNLLQSMEVEIHDEEIRLLEEATKGLKDYAGRQPDMYQSESRVRYRN